MQKADKKNVNTWVITVRGSVTLNMLGGRIARGPRSRREWDNIVASDGRYYHVGAFSMFSIKLLLHDISLAFKGMTKDLRE